VPIDPERLRTGGALLGPLGRGVLPPPPELPALDAGARVGPFRVEHELSRGGMAIVYAATRVDGEFTQRVALKWMAAAGDRAVAEAMFRRERDIVASLEHPGIARLIDGGRTDQGMLWFAMELVDGQPIDRWCDARRAPLTVRVRLTLALCEALAFAHARLLIHRDVKPANVLVDARGQVKLLDFGIARLADQQDLLGNFALTPGFASPEQWSGEEITVRSDVYQVGLLLATLLGCARGDEDGAHATCTESSSGSPAQPRALDARRLMGLPRDVAVILARATALDPARRYSNMEALADDLRRALEHRPVDARQGGVGYRTVCFARRHPFGIALAALGVAALAALGGWLAVERDAARREAQRAVVESTRARTALDFLVELLNWAKPAVARGQAVTVDAALAHGVEQLGSRLGEQPRLRGELLLMLGGIYLQRRERDQARPLLEEADALLGADPEVDRALRAKAALYVGSVLSEAADRGRSLDALERAIELCGDDASGYRLSARRIKAIRHYQDGELEQTLAEIETALGEAAAMQAPDPNELRRLRVDYADTLAEAGRPTDALVALEEALASARRELGVDHPDTSHIALKVANRLTAAGRHAEAGLIFEAERALRVRLWGEAHPEFGHWLQSHARWLQLGGRREEALGEIERAIALAHAQPAFGRTQLAAQYELLGMLREEAGDLEAAEAAYRRATDPPVQGASLNQDFGERRLRLAGVLRQRGALDEAQGEIDAVAVAVAPLGSDHPRRAKLAYERARLALARGDRRAATDFVRDALARAPALQDAEPLATDIERLAAELGVGRGP
jgi:serine/threonine-protein kinase